MTQNEKILLEQIHDSNYHMLDEIDRICKKHGIQYFLACGCLLGAVRHQDFIPWDDDADIWMFPKEFKKLYAARDEFSKDIRILLPEEYGADKYFNMVPKVVDTSLVIRGGNDPVVQYYGEENAGHSCVDIFLLGRNPGKRRGKCYKNHLCFWYAMGEAYRCPSLSGINNGKLEKAKKLALKLGKLFSVKFICKRCWKLIEKYEDTNYSVFVANDRYSAIIRLDFGVWFDETVELTMRSPHKYLCPKEYDNILKMIYGNYMALPPEGERHPHSIYDYEDGARYPDSKIKVDWTPKYEKLANTKREDMEIPEEWLRIINKPNGTPKKIILYGNGIGSLLSYNEKMIAKIKSIFDIFKENRDEVVLLWRPQPMIESTLPGMRPQLWEAYKAIRDSYLAEGWGIYDDTADLDRAVVISDAYYGDGNDMAQMYMMGKPIMILNAEV